MVALNPVMLCSTMMCLSPELIRYLFERSKESSVRSPEINIIELIGYLFERSKESSVRSPGINIIELIRYLFERSMKSSVRSPEINIIELIKYLFERSKESSVRSPAINIIPLVWSLKIKVKLCQITCNKHHTTCLIFKDQRKALSIRSSVKLYIIVGEWLLFNANWASVRYVLDQHDELDFYSASWQKQRQSAGGHVAPLEHIILIPSFARSP